MSDRDKSEPTLQGYSYHSADNLSPNYSELRITEIIYSEYHNHNVDKRPSIDRDQHLTEESPSIHRDKRLTEESRSIHRDKRLTEDSSLFHSDEACLPEKKESEHPNHLITAKRNPTETSTPNGRSNWSKTWTFLGHC